ncbi:MAG TPA: ECF-type sigma factor [Phycisphaerales bacterium]|nr:ECF-type sigma factor [Phycisphaerales bacterium]
MGGPGDETVTDALASLERGEAGARERLMALVYDELRALARARMAEESPGATLEPTALVHEAYLRLVGERAPWRSRGQFFGAASLAMRRILVDRARARAAQKRGGDRDRVTVADFEADPAAGGVDIVALDDALTRLGAMDARLAEVVQLRFFAGLSVEQTAEALGSSERTVKRDWSFARAWLHKELAAGAGRVGA